MTTMDDAPEVPALECALPQAPQTDTAAAEPGQAEERTLPSPIHSAQTPRLDWRTQAEVAAAVQAQAARVAAHGRAWLLIHADFGVGFGYADSREVGLPPDMADLLNPGYLQELRLFGLEGEWHAWRIREGFCARLRVDAKTDSSEWIEEHQALWGTQTEVGPVSGWTTLREQRGACLCVPHAVSHITPERRLRLRVRHYLYADPETHLTTYSDSRLVALCDVSGAPLPWPAKVDAP